MPTPVRRRCRARTFSAVVVCLALSACGTADEPVAAQGQSSERATTVDARPTAQATPTVSPSAEPLPDVAVASSEATRSPDSLFGTLLIDPSGCVRLFTREGSYALVLAPEVDVNPRGEYRALTTGTGRRINSNEEVEVRGGVIPPGDGRLGGSVSPRCMGVRWQVTQFVEAPKPPAFVPVIPPAVGNDDIRVVATEPCQAGCGYVIEYAANGGWHRASAPKLLGNAVQVVSRGDHAYVLIGHDPAHGAKAITTYLLVSADRGRSWFERPDPCAVDPAVPSDAREAAVGFDGTLVLLCAGIGKGLQSLRFSADHGTTFEPPATIPGEITIAIAAHVAVAGAGNVLVSGFAAATPETVEQGPLGQSSDAVILRTTDRGATFDIVVRTPQHDHYIDGSLRFISPTNAEWVSPNSRGVFYSPDGGQTWNGRRLAK